MVRNGFSGVLIVVFLLSNAQGHTALAQEAGKIYSRGEWREAEQPVDISPMTAGVLGMNGGISLQNIAQKFINLNVNAFLGNGHEGKLTVKNIVAGGDIQTVRFSKRWRGLPVVGSESLVQIKDGKVLFATGDDTRLDHLSDAGIISADQAKATAFASYAGEAKLASEPQLKVLALSSEAPAELVYEVTVRDYDGFSSDNHFINAHTGNEVLVTSNVHTARDRKVLAGKYDSTDFELDDTNWRVIYADKGCPTTTSSNPLNLPWANRRITAPRVTSAPCSSTESERVMASATAAWDHSGIVYDFFRQAHGRDSLDNLGMQVKSVVNFGGPRFINAAWVAEKNVMLYGMGDGVRINDFALALDVVGHELVHGITSHTAQLTYAAESGALNESFSDVFGRLIYFKAGRGVKDWVLGRDLVKSGDGKEFTRDMANPEVGHTRDQKYKGEFCHRFNDMCGVHTNSGIPNKAAVLIAKKLGNDKVAKLYYLTLTQLLRSSSDFKEARAQTEAACRTLWGQNSPNCKVVSDSFEAVGITAAR